LPDQDSRAAAVATRTDRAAGMSSALRRPIPEAAAPMAAGPQSRPLAEDRGMRCVLLDYDTMRGVPRTEATLF
jgi:hypothetical protein